jgi:hypothetical protein
VGWDGKGEEEEGGKAALNRKLPAARCVCQKPSRAADIFSSYCRSSHHLDDVPYLCPGTGLRSG